MTGFNIHNTETAPAASAPLLQNSLNAFGMIPNLHGAMAEAPTLLEGYQVLHGLAQKTSFSAEELTVVWQSINVEHECHYCVPAHTAIAHAMKVDQKVIDGLRNNTELPTPKLEALRAASLAILRHRGKVNTAELDGFYSSGYGQQQVLEIILILAQKIMSNYTNHLAATPVDQPFQQFI